MRSRNWSRVGSDRLVRSQCRGVGRPEVRMEVSRGSRGVVEEGAGRAEGEVLAPPNARFQTEAGKSQGKVFDHVCNP